MFTDSAFYSPQHHPSVAEQVEMAHRLSSSLYDEGNRTSVGQEMFMRRAKKSGKWVHQSARTSMIGFGGEMNEMINRCSILCCMLGYYSG